MRSEVALARIAIGVVALHVVDDNFLQPNPGTSAGDHLVGGLVPLALLVPAGAVYPRLRAGARATIALLAGFFGVLVGTRPSTTQGGRPVRRRLHRAAVDSCRPVAARPRRRDAVEVATDGRPLWWRYGRRLLITAGALVVAPVVLFPFALSYVVTHAARAHVPAADLGAPYEEVEFTTSDGLLLKGWYIESQNGAAVISFPGRASSQTRAKMLADHGYGVLLFDRRGEGESEGDPNLFGWQGERDIHAAVSSSSAAGRRSRADRRHRPLGRRRDDDRGRRRVQGAEGDRLRGR